jgi:hypothetical protein
MVQSIGYVSSFDEARQAVDFEAPIALGDTRLENAARAISLSDRITQHLRTHPDGMLKKVLASELEANERTVATTLSALKAKQW